MTFEKQRLWVKSKIKMIMKPKKLCSKKIQWTVWKRSEMGQRKKWPQVRFIVSKKIDPQSVFLGKICVNKLKL